MERHSLTAPPGYPIALSTNPGLVDQQEGDDQWSPAMQAMLDNWEKGSKTTAIEQYARDLRLGVPDPEATIAFHMREETARKTGRQLPN